MAFKPEMFKKLKGKKPEGKIGDKQAEDQLDEEAGADETPEHEAGEEPAFEADEDAGLVSDEADAGAGAGELKDVSDEDLFAEMQARGLSMNDYQDFINAPGKPSKESF
jgi:hypothetical protein